MTENKENKLISDILENETEIFDDTDFDALDLFFKEYEEHNKKIKDLYLCALDFYKNNMCSVWSEEDWEDTSEEWFNIDNYGLLEHVGYCTITETNKKFQISNIEYAEKVGQDISYPEIKNLRIHKQSFVNDKNLNMFVHQREEFDDCYYGYMFFPLKGENRYWILYYNC